MLDREALALMALGFRPCFYLELWCKDHGAIRCAGEFESTGNRHPCPICHAMR